MTVKRKLTTIFCADVVGYSRLMGVDEPGTLKRLKSCREMMAGFIEHHHGRVVSWSGDAVLADFSSVVESLQCAMVVQSELKARNETVPAQERMEFRIGINLGDVMIDEHDIFGEGVNIASRLQSLAPPGGILVSGSVYEQVRNKLSAGFNFLGEQNVKNIADKVPAYVVVPERAQATAADVAAALAEIPAVPATAMALRAAAGATDGFIAFVVAFGLAVPLQGAGLTIADLSMPFGLLSSERVVKSQEPSTEIRDGGAVVVIRNESLVNRTVLGVATQSYRVTDIETTRSGRTSRSSNETMVDARSGREIAAPSVFWLALGAYFALLFATEGAGRLRRSPGKSLFGLDVQSAGGASLSPAAGIWRNVAKVASVVPLFAGFLLPLWTKKPQALHDLLAGARVVTR
jgi:class 3 adenylate cyclase